MYTYLKILVILLFIVPFTNNAQDLIDLSNNYILNDHVLDSLFKKIEQGKKANILHIGDSHIQANYLTGKIRKLFNEQYGSASRGIVFPLRLLKTNGPLDIRFSSNIKWYSKKITQRNNKSCGIAGATITTQKPNFYIRLINKKNIKIKNLKIIGKGLQKLKIGIPNKKISKQKTRYITKIYRVKPGDVLSRIARRFKTSVSMIKRLNNLKKDRIYINQKLKINKKNNYNKPIKLTNFELIEPSEISNQYISVEVNHETVKDIYIISHENKAKSYTKIDGIFLDDNTNGITYHSIGINGAKYSDYNRSELFFKQVNYTKPDLIILALGTNESFYNSKNRYIFNKDVNTFITKIRKTTTCNNIILASPPSSLIKRRKENTKLKSFTSTLKNIANKNNYGFWDLLKITGGTKGIKKWYAKGLAASDKIHYSRKGYELQAELLFKALHKRNTIDNRLLRTNKQN